MVVGNRSAIPIFVGGAVAARIYAIGRTGTMAPLADCPLKGIRHRSLDLERTSGHMAVELETTPHGIRPPEWHLVGIANMLAQKGAEGHRRIALTWLTDLKPALGCRTEELVEMIEYLIETKSPLMAEFSLEMHLTDAIIQCKMQRVGEYRREDWQREEHA